MQTLGVGGGGNRHGHEHHHELWDEDFKQKKFELGRIIERDLAHLTMRDLERMNLEGGSGSA